jgi:tetratricopeptide (TPR) repeat protein
MSPEQATGERVGHLSDLYALSITLYELLVGHPPFSSETPWKTLDLQLRAPPPPLRQVRHDVPVELEQVILRALEKSPADRFQSAREMHEALARAAGVNSTVIVTPGSGHATTRLGVTAPAGPDRRRLIPWLVIAGLAAAVVLVLAFELGGNRGGTVGSASPTSVPRAATAPPADATVVAAGPVVVATGVPTSLPNPTLAPSTATAVPPTPTPSPGQRLDAARALLDQQRYPEAIAAMNAIRDSDPSTPGLDDALYQAHMGYGGKLLAQDDVEGSYAEYGAALKLRPNDQAALNGQQQVILLKHWHEMQACWGKDDDCTLTALEQIYAVNPDYRQTREKLYAQLIAKADRLLAAGDRAGAYTVLMHALDVNPNGAEAADRLVSYTPTPVPAPEYVAPAQQSSGGTTSSGAGTGGASGGGYRGSSAGSSSGGGASSGGGGGAPPPARPLRP